MSLRIGAVVYATDQGLGMLGKQFYDNGLVTDIAVFQHPHPSRPTHWEWYPNCLHLMNRPFAGVQVDRFLEDIDVCLFFETAFDWPFLLQCKARGVKTVLIPMYEWAPTRFDYRPDLFICPSLLDVEYFPGSPFIPIPVDPSTWKQRYTATRFLHNGGHLGCRGHKGTLELLQAMQYVNSPMSLTIRSQDVQNLQAIVRQSGVNVDDPRLKIEYGQIPYDQLFDGYDALIAPEKFNGLSLPLQEARAAGMLVITSDRFPHNTWLPKESLIPVNQYQRARVSAGHNEFDEAIINPQDIAATIDAHYGTNIEGYSETGRIWAEENSWEKLKPVYLEVLEKLCHESKQLANN